MQTSSKIPHPGEPLQNHTDSYADKKPHANPDTYRYTNPNQYSDADTNTHQYTYADINADQHADTHLHCVPDVHSFTKSYIDSPAADADAHTYKHTSSLEAVAHHP